jgi:hypothetical protein
MLPSADLQGAARERAMFDTGRPASDLYDILRVGPTCFQKSSGFCVHCCDVVLKGKGATGAGAGAGSTPPMTKHLTKSAIQAAWHRQGSTMCLSPALMAHFGLQPTPGMRTVVAATAASTDTITDADAAQRRPVWVLVSQLLAALPVEERPSWGRTPDRQWFTTVLPILREDNVTVAGWAQWEKTHECPPRIRGFVNAALAEVAKLKSGRVAPAPVPAPMPAPPVDALFGTRREDSVFAAGGNGWAGRSRAGASLSFLQQPALPGFVAAPKRPVAPGAFLRPTFDGDQDCSLLPGAVPKASPTKAPVPDVLWAWKRDSTQGPIAKATVDVAQALPAAATTTETRKKPADEAGEKAKGLPAASGEGEGEGEGGAAVPKADEDTKGKALQCEGVARFTLKSKGPDGMATLVTDGGREVTVRLNAPQPAEKPKGDAVLAAPAVIKADTIAPEVRKALYPALPALPVVPEVPRADDLLVIGSPCGPCETDPSGCTHVCQVLTGKDRSFVALKRLPRDVIAAHIADKRDKYSPEEWDHFCL